MGTLEGALEAVFGYNTVHNSRGKFELQCIPEVTNLEEQTSHQLRELLIAHSQQRAYLKRKVSSST